jgi:hypothetical protein
MNSSEPNEILIRRADPADAAELRRLARLDSVGAPPPEPLLVAELDGVIGAALSLSDGSAIADPFRPTANAVELLRVRGSASVSERSPAPSRLRDRVRRP